MNEKRIFSTALIEVGFIDFCFSVKPSMAARCHRALGWEIYGPLAERDEIEIREYLC